MDQKDSTAMLAMKSSSSSSVGVASGVNQGNPLHANDEAQDLWKPSQMSPEIHNRDTSDPIKGLMSSKKNEK